MKLNNSNLDYWKMSAISLADSLNIVEFNCTSKDCRDCDCDNRDSYFDCPDDEEDDDEYDPDDYETDRDVNGDW